MPRCGEEACACPDGGEAKRSSGLGVSMLVNLCSGVAAGSVASIVTQPFDLIKTRVMAAQLGPAGRPRQASTYGALRDIVAVEGPRAMWRGLVRLLPGRRTCRAACCLVSRPNRAQAGPVPGTARGLLPG